MLICAELQLHRERKSKKQNTNPNNFPENSLISLIGDMCSPETDKISADLWRLVCIVPDIGESIGEVSVHETIGLCKREREWKERDRIKRDKVDKGKL